MFILMKHIASKNIKMRTEKGKEDPNEIISIH